MPIKIRRDLLYTILNHIRGLQEMEVRPRPMLSERDFGQLDATPAEVIGHLDYLYQKGMIIGQFEPGSYGDRRLEQGGTFAEGEIAQEQYGYEPRLKVEAAPDPLDIAPLDGSVEVDNVRLTAAGQAALAELEREGHAPEPSRLS